MGESAPITTVSINQQHQKQQLNCTQRVPMVTAPTIQAAVMVESARITTAPIQQAQHQLRDV